MRARAHAQASERTPPHIPQRVRSVPHSPPPWSPAFDALGVSPANAENHTGARRLLCFVCLLLLAGLRGCRSSTSGFPCATPVLRPRRGTPLSHTRDPLSFLVSVFSLSPLWGPLAPLAARSKFDGSAQCRPPRCSSLFFFLLLLLSRKELATAVARACVCVNVCACVCVLGATLARLSKLPHFRCLLLSRCNEALPCSKPKALAFSLFLPCVFAHSVCFKACVCVRACPAPLPRAFFVLLCGAVGLFPSPCPISKLRSRIASMCRCPLPFSFAVFVV